VPPWACLPGWPLGPLHRVLPKDMAIFGKSNIGKAGKNILRGL
jgi:hypothetical protein